MALTVKNADMGYITGEFIDEAIFGGILLTANNSGDAFVARFQELGLSSGTYQKTLSSVQTDLTEDNSVFVYPNPANDKVNIDLMFSKEMNTKIVLIDLLGNIIQTLDEGVYSKHRIVMETGNLAGGMYLIRVETTDKTVQKKLSVIH
jgi:hypothetical protein